MTPSIEVGTFPDDEKLINLAKAFDEAGYAFWKRYQKVGPKSCAVLWLDNSENGHFLIFTRSEGKSIIKDYLKEAVASIS